MTENKPINTCEFFDICETDCGGTLEDTEICSCYELYKQLTRKTQECEEALKQLEFVRTQNTVLCSEINQLKAENEKWQKEYWKLEKGNDFLAEKSSKLKAENEQLKAKSTEWKTFDVSFDNGIAKTQISDLSLAEYSDIKLERDKAEQKLAEIKEIAMAIMDDDVEESSYYSDARQILQIIDEVE